MTETNYPKELYSEKCIQKAVEDYKALAKIIVTQNNDTWMLCFNNCKYDESRTVSEFENYLIELENQ